MHTLVAMLLGFILDALLGDPRNIPHPVVGMGWLIDHLEALFRRLLPRTPRGENAAGALIWLVTALASTALPAAVLYGAYGLHPWLGVCLEGVMCWQILAARSLKTEAMKVYAALNTGDITVARQAVSMIVGRETATLDEAGVARAAVETVAENTSDGVVAPLCFLALGGAPLGFFYKAVNTMDSMLGYTDPPYQHIGLVPAKVDDAANFLPARLSALLMLLAGRTMGLDVRNGWKIFRRDRRNHASPNSAQTEAVCAGLLGLRLAGDAWYHGVLHKKPFIGDDLRPIEPADIPRTCTLMYRTAALALLLCGGLRLLLWR